ncbi:MAG: M56 family metallopeptidase, partial [Longimicrobiales bacterium]
MTPFAMLYTIAAGVPIAWAALALAAVLRRYGRPERGVWLAALVLALVAPAVVLLDLFGTPVVPTAPPVVGVIGLPEFVVIPVPESSMDFGELVLIAWLLVSTGLAARWGVAAYRLAQASRSWQPGTIDGVSVWMTEDVGPAVSGVFRPKVLAPSWLHTLPGSQRALVLMHEEEHVRAHDPLVIAFTRLARILAPWNPVVWLLSSRLVRAVELDCDRRVLRRTSDVAAYGHTLLTVSERRPGHLIAAAAFAESEAPLRTRILNMTTPPRAISLAAIGAATVLGVVLL